MFRVEYNEGESWQEHQEVFEDYEEAVEVARNIWDTLNCRVRVVDKKGCIPFYRGRSGSWTDYT